MDSQVFAAARSVGKVVTQEMTPAMATFWLETMQYEHQRNVRQEHVEFLAEEMRRGRFIQGTQIHVVVCDGKHSIVDGQHRLWAVILSETKQQFTVLTTHVARKEEIAWIYGNTDIGMRRTGAHLLGAMELDVEIGCTKTQIRYLSGAINFMSTGCLRNPNSSQALHKDDMVRWIRLYAPYARDYFKLMEKSDRHLNRSLFRSSTLSMALLTLRFADPLAKVRKEPSVIDFWRGAAFDDGIQVGDPRKFVNRHLMTASVISSVTDATGDIVSIAYSARYIAGCFNAYMEGRAMKQPKVSDPRSVLRIHGVPADMAQWWQ